MSVLVDSTIWSLGFRRQHASSPEAFELANLITNRQAAIIGAIRQEVLSGIRDPIQFIKIRGQLQAFPDLALNEDYYERAAEFYNSCRSRGIQGSNTDFLICAAADLHGMSIYTADADFKHFAKHLPIRLHTL